MFRSAFRSYSTKPRSLLLLALDWTRPKDPPMSLGQAGLLANLKKHNIPMKANAWSVNHPDFKVDDVYNYVMQHANVDTDLGLGAFVWHEPETQELLNRLRASHFPGRIILGGPQVSYTKHDIERYYPQADIFIRGYAEDALAKLFLSTQKFPVITGVHYANQPSLGSSANSDFENLPSPYLTGIIKPQRFIRWETQRGCPFRCAFCQHRESDVTMKRQHFPQTRIMQEVQWILANPVIQDIAVLDPTFNSGSYYLEIIEAFIAGKYTGKIALQCRAEMVTEEFLDAIERLNQTANVVLEFGLQTIHKEEQRIIQRPNNMTKVEYVLKETKRRKIETEVSLIFGLPNQTVESFQESINFCKRLEVPTIYAYPLMLLRGTPLYDQKLQLNLIESYEVDLQIPRIQKNIPHVIASPSFTYEQWLQMAEIAENLDEYNATQAAFLQRKSAAKMSATLQHTMWNDTVKVMPADAIVNDVQLITNKLSA